MDHSQLEKDFLEGLDEDLGALGLLPKDAIPNRSPKPNGAAGMPKRATFKEFGAIEETKLYMSMTFFSFFKKLQVSANHSIDLQNLTVTQCFLLVAIAVKQTKGEEAIAKAMAYNFSMDLKTLLDQLEPLADSNYQRESRSGKPKKEGSSALIVIERSKQEQEKIVFRLTTNGEKLMESIVSTKIFRT